jgi:hypothetical protein
MDWLGGGGTTWDQREKGELARGERRKKPIAFLSLVQVVMVHGLSPTHKDSQAHPATQLSQAHMLGRDMSVDID